MLITLIACLVISVTDGDTIKCRDVDNQVYKVRLLTMDAPETHSNRCLPQPFSQESKEYLTALVQDKQVVLETKGQDFYGRTLAVVKLDNIDINNLMIEQGFAEVYRGATGYKKHAYYQTELQARQGNVGMWSNLDYESPMTYRKRCK